MTLSDSKNNHAAPHDIKTDVIIDLKENWNNNLFTKTRLFMITKWVIGLYT